MKKPLFLFGCIVALLCNSAYGFNETIIHPKLTEKAVKNSTLLDPYFKTHLNIENGINEVVDNKKAIEWIKEGAEHEDKPMCRAANHFHNPYLPWGGSGLTDTSKLVNIYCFLFSAYKPDSIVSNITWATGLLSRNASDTYNDVIQQNEWDLKSAREYFYTFLTGMDYNGSMVATTAADREKYMTKSLSALGHVLHLLQDMAVPAHVKNDFSQGHTMFIPGPDWEWIGNGFELYVKRNSDRVWFNSSVRTTMPNVFYSDFWDTTDGVSGIDPGKNSTTMGLSEYTAVNFSSEYRIFEPGFPYPKAEHCVIELDEPVYGIPDFEGQYISSTNGHPGEQVRHLLVVSSLHHFRKKYFPNISNEELPVGFDDNCYEEYAAKLIPRAIGYSTDMIDYFFRGNFSVSQAFPERNDEGEISGLKLEVKNASKLDEGSEEIEPFGAGNIVLSCKYIPPGAEEPVYNLVEDVYTLHDAGDAINSVYVPIHANFAPPIPPGAKDLSFTLVFRGKLGQEADAVAARAFKFTSRIAYDYQPDGTGNMGIYTILPDGTGACKITDATDQDSHVWDFKPEWSLNGRLAFIRKTCSEIDGVVCPADGWKNEIQVIDMFSEKFFPGNLVSTLGLKASDHWEYTPLNFQRALIEISPDQKRLESLSISPDGNRIVAIVECTPATDPLVFDISSESWEVINDFGFWNYFIDLTPPDPLYHGPPKPILLRNVILVWGQLQNSAPAWSPLGDLIAYYRAFQILAPGGDNITSGGNIFLISPDGGEEINITNDNDGEYMNTQPAWSPDGKQIVFVSDRDGENIWDIWIMDRNGDNKRKIIDCDSNCYHPSFSPDGQEIAFEKYGGDLKGGDIFTVNIKGQGLRRVTTSGFAGSPSWSPWIFEASVP